MFPFFLSAQGISRSGSLWSRHRRLRFARARRNPPRLSRPRFIIPSSPLLHPLPKLVLLSPVSGLFGDWTFTATEGTSRGWPNGQLPGEIRVRLCADRGLQQQCPL